MEIGKIIKEQRSERKMTQEDLANEFYVSRQLISKWENGRSYPDLEQLLKLSDFFELTLDELLRGDKKMVASMSVGIKKKRMMIGVILLLVGVIISMGYNTWSKQVLFLKPDDVEIVSINKIKTPEKTVYDSVLKKEIVMPEDIKYQIEIKNKKAFTKINSAEVYGTQDIDDPNVYIYIQGHPSIFNHHKFEMLSIDSNPKIGYMENEAQVSNNKGKSIRMIDIESYISNESQLDHSWQWIEKETLE